jgi:hypothetical protein
VFMALQDGDDGRLRGYAQCQRKRDGEHSIFAHFARDRYGATTAVNNAFADRQAQPHARLPIGAATEERQENAREVFWWYADASVG